MCARNSEIFIIASVLKEKLIALNSKGISGFAL
jgi:hypothetical protein